MGGVPATSRGTACGTCCASSPASIDCGSVATSPACVRLKNKPMDSTWPVFVVARMPDACSRSCTRAEFMICVLFGATKTSEPSPKASSNAANVA